MRASQNACSRTCPTKACPILGVVPESRCKLASGVDGPGTETLTAYLNLPNWYNGGLETALSPMFARRGYPRVGFNTPCSMFDGLVLPISRLLWGNVGGVL